MRNKKRNNPVRVSSKRLKFQQSYEVELQNCLNALYRCMGGLVAQSGVLNQAAICGIMTKSLDTSEETRQSILDNVLHSISTPFVNSLMNPDSRAGFVEFFTHYYLAAYTLGAVHALKVLGTNATPVDFLDKKSDYKKPFILKDRRIVEKLRQRATERVREVFLDLIANLKTMLSDSLVVGYDPDKLKTVFANNWIAPSTLVNVYASKDVKYVFNLAAFDVYSRSGVKRKSWFPRNSAPPENASQNGYVDMEAQFSNGELFPGQSLTHDELSFIVPEVSNVTPWLGAGSGKRTKSNRS